MGLTLTEIDEFREFAIRKVTNGGIASLEACVELWNDEREYAESIAGIRESLEDISAGRTRPIDESVDDIRRQLGFLKDQPDS
jgi:hypothetical protein